MKILFVLQNGYHSPEYDYRNLEEWYVDLWRSHTGRRLSGYIPRNCIPLVINASPVVGQGAASYHPPDPQHLKKMLRKYRPDLVVACGKAAHQGLCELDIPHVETPHPAYRALTNSTVERIRRKLERMCK